MDWLTRFPHMNDDSLRELKKAIDEGFRAFTRAYGDGIEAFFEPLATALVLRFGVLLISLPLLVSCSG